MSELSTNEQQNLTNLLEELAKQAQKTALLIKQKRFPILLEKESCDENIVKSIVALCKDEKITLDYRKWLLIISKKVYFELHKEGFSTDDFAKLFHVDYSAAKGYLHRMGVKRKVKKF